MMRIAISGAAGQMGRVLLDACHHSEDVCCTVALEQPDSQFLGTDAGELAGIGKLDLTITSDVASLLDQFEVLVDFTNTSATLGYLAVCQVASKAMVIGTTGFSYEQKFKISQAAEMIPIVFSPNMSICVNICFKLLELTAQAIGDKTDIEIIEAHHRRKIDAPSGTALAMGEVIANEFGLSLEQCTIYDRKELPGFRDHARIGFSTLRGGDVIGEHTAIFFDMGERIEITHRASNRMAFAHGALRAVVWLAGRKAGLFDMRDVLNMR